MFVYREQKLAPTLAQPRKVEFMAFDLQESVQKSKITVILYASYRLILDSLETLISTGQEISVTGSSNSLYEIKNLIREKNPAVAVLCLMENEAASVEIISELQEINPSAKILVVTCSDDIDGHLRAVQLGATGVMYKNQDGRMLLRAIRQIYDGETWFNQKLIARILNGDPQVVSPQSEKNNQKLDSVTKRELEIIGLIARGLRNKAIAGELYISEATVRHHLSSIYGKLGVEDRLNLVIYAYQNKLIK